MLTQPIATETMYNRAQIQENMQLDRDAHAQMLEENAYLRGRMERLEQQVDEIDIYGSRRWNKDTINEN